VYATLKYEFNPYGNLKPYIKANIGYSINIQGDLGSVDNGMYYAAGVGVDYKNFIVDLSYQYNEGSVTIPGYTGNNVDYDETKTDANVGRVTLGLGYRFN
jgi:opacity protein-like surface antigen